MIRSVYKESKGRYGSPRIAKELAFNGLIMIDAASQRFFKSWKLYWIVVLNCILIFQSGCDFISPQRSFKLAVPEKDYSYNYSAKHLKAFLEKGGFKIELIFADNAIDANRMVSIGEADLTFAMDHSDFIPAAIGSEAGKLRTITPLFQRLFFLFSKTDLDTLDREAEFSKKSIGVEVLNGETHHNLVQLLAASKLDHVKIIDRDEDPDFIHFWGTYYGERATTLLNNGWYEISIDPDWVNFMTLNDPAIDPFILPAIPGVEGSVNLSTMSARTLFVCGAHLPDNAIYKLSEYLFQNKLDLVGHDKMYRFISESFDNRQILFPVHVGTDKYLRRNQPSVFERYAELMALIFSVGAIIYGAFQGIRNRLIRIKKERIDVYFLRYLEIRSETKFTTQEKTEKLSELLQRALVQLTNEKLDINDFHIFSRLIQQELVILKQL